MNNKVIMKMVMTVVMVNRDHYHNNLITKTKKINKNKIVFDI